MPPPLKETPVKPGRGIARFTGLYLASGGIYATANATAMRRKAAIYTAFMPPIYLF